MGFAGTGIISRFERDQAFPPVERLALLARKYPVDVHWLITGERAPGAHATDAELYKVIVRALRLAAALSLEVTEAIELDERDLQECMDRKSKGEPPHQDIPFYDEVLRSRMAYKIESLRLAKETEEWLRPLFEMLEHQRRQSEAGTDQARTGKKI